MALLHDSTPARVGAAFPPHRSRHQGVGLRPAELGHPVEDVTLDRTVQITMRVKRSVLTYFKAAGKGYQTRINLVPESYVRARRQSR